MASSSSSSIRHRRPSLVEHDELPADPEDKEHEEEEARDWADQLPLDALLAVLGRLDVVDILLGAGLVCRPWCRAAREEPELWRHIRGHAKLASAGRIRAAMDAAVRRSDGRCEAFRADDFGGDQYSFSSSFPARLPI
ncbi:unnamed protein product [Urochloa humidicola]